MWEWIKTNSTDLFLIVFGQQSSEELDGPDFGYSKFISLFYDKEAKKIFCIERINPTYVF